MFLRDSRSKGEKKRGKERKKKEAFYDNEKCL